MLAAEIMTTDVVTARPDMSVVELASLLTARRISGVPVVANGRIVGMISEGDLLRRSELGSEHVRSPAQELATPSDQLAREYVREHGRTVADVMTRDVLEVQHDDDVAEIAAFMERHRIKRVPVLRAGELVGIISRADLVQALIVHGRTTGPGRPASTDLEIRQAIMDELRRHRWGGFPTHVHVVVRSGVAHLFGDLRSEAEHRALLTAVTTRPGVAEVEDHMTYPGLRPRPKAGSEPSGEALVVHGDASR